MLLMVAVAAAVVVVALTERNRFEPSAAAKLKAASRTGRQFGRGS